MICAIHPSLAVGIDIERIKLMTDLTLAKRYFTDTEYQALLQIDESLQTDAFYFLWAAKEAIIKAAEELVRRPTA